MAEPRVTRSWSVCHPGEVAPSIVRVLLALSTLAIAGCGARTGITVRDGGVPVDATDASTLPNDAHDAARMPDANDAAPFCPPDASCDCFVGGELIWQHVIYAVADASTVGGDGARGEGWGSDMHLEARCGGVYTITARVISLGSRCEIASIHTGVDLRDPRFGARARMPLWTANGDCVTEALTRTGGETCVTISWNATGGGTGEVALGCFAAFGPYCFGGPGCGAGGMADGAMGDWTF